MKTQATVCDSSGCRRLADDACVICERDLCAEHAQIKLRCVVDVYDEEGKTSEETLTHDEGTGFKPPGRTKATLCVSCKILMRGNNLLREKRGAFSRKLLLDFFAAIVEHAKAIKATEVLTEDKK